MKHAIIGIVLVVVVTLTASAQNTAQSHTEALLSTENAYNPAPSPDGKSVAYVRAAWGPYGFGRGDFLTDVSMLHLDGSVALTPPIRGVFLSAWASDGRLVCYRDGIYVIGSENGKTLQTGHLRRDGDISRLPERVSYLSGSGTVIWSRRDNEFHTVIESSNGVLAQHGGWLGDLVVPSPDGRYLAVTGTWFPTRLWVYDTKLRRWADLGEAEIHPDRNWDYIKPSWHPWFADSSRLAYFTQNNTILSLSTPDGKQRTNIRIGAIGGLATPSPDGKFVAYVTFESRPMKLRPDLPFWGGTKLWIIPLNEKSVPRPVTSQNPDETYDLRWLDEYTLIFDRIADVMLLKQARIWKVDVRR